MNFDLLRLLPSELLIKIACYLPGKDVNCLLQTSKEIRGKLERYRYLLPKRTARSIKLAAFRKMFQLFVLLHDGDKFHQWKIILTAEPNAHDEEQRMNEWEIREQLTNIYYGNCQNPVYQNWPQGIREGLSQHFRYLVSIFHIEKLVVDDLNMKQFDIVITELKQQRTRVDELQMTTDNTIQSHLDLIEAIKPAVLRFDSKYDFPEAFFKMPEIRQMNCLTATTFETKVSAVDVLALSAAELRIGYRTHINVSLVSSFLQQWVESKRTIKDVTLDMEMTATAEEWRRVFERMNRDLVEIGEFKADYDEEIVGQPLYSTTLRRIADNVLLIIEFFDEKVKLCES